MTKNSVNVDTSTKYKVGELDVHAVKASDRRWKGHGIRGRISPWSEKFGERERKHVCSRYVVYKKT